MFEKKVGLTNYQLKIFPMKMSTTINMKIISNYKENSKPKRVKIYRPKHTVEQIY